MSALSELARVGLRARVVDGRLQVGPPGRLTPEAREFVRRLAADLRRELAKPPDPLPPAEPRYRAWSMFRPDGSRAGTLLCPAGMTRAEAMAALPRAGWTVEPLPASRC
jgi:hypothetical protein